MKKKNRSAIDGFHVAAFIVGFVIAVVLVQSPVQNESVSLSTLPQQSMLSNAYVLAVTNNDVGLIGSVDVEITEGRGRVLINTNPFLEPDTQFSADTAAAIAEQYTRKSLEDRDVIYSFNINGQVLGGPSAGAAMTAATIAAIEDRQIRDDVAITGTIRSDGTVGPVGGILEKMEAAADEGVTLFLVPNGQGTLTYYERVVDERSRGGFIYQRVRYVPETIDVNEYANSELGIEVMEVTTIDDVVSYMLT